MAAIQLQAGGTGSSSRGGSMTLRDMTTGNTSVLITHARLHVCALPAHSAVWATLIQVAPWFDGLLPEKGSGLCNRFYHTHSRRPRSSGSNSCDVESTRSKGKEKTIGFATFLRGPTDFDGQRRRLRSHDSAADGLHGARPVFFL